MKRKTKQIYQEGHTSIYFEEQFGSIVKTILSRVNDLRFDEMQVLALGGSIRYRQV